MNNKGFTLIELLGCFALLGIVFGIALYFTKGTFSTALTTMDKISENEIYSASKSYILEHSIKWSNKNNKEYYCVSVSDLVQDGYFDYDEVSSNKDNFVKLYRDSNTKVIDDMDMVKECN